jgi:predicted metal-dependent phosphoesterase TrpH
MRVDLHSHTHHSPDSRMAFEDIAAACRKAGIDVLASTDHNTAEGALAFREWAREHAPDLHVIVGEEVMTPDGEIIGLYLEETIPEGTPLEETVEAIRDQGGIVLLQHPFDPYRHGLEERSWDITPDLVEVHNARTRKGKANAKARAHAEERGLPMVACSDAHTLGEFGVSYTVTDDFDPSDPEALVAAVAGGQVVEETSSVWVNVRSQFTKLLHKVGL